MEECDDDLSEWTDDEMMDQDNNSKMDEDYDDDDDDDDEILKDMNYMTPNDPTILQIRKNQNEIKINRNLQIHYKNNRKWNRYCIFQK